MPKTDFQPNDVYAEINNTTIRVSTPRGPKTYSLPDLFAIDDSNLSNEFMGQAAIYAYFATMVSFAEQRVADLELKKDQTYARLDEYYRDKAEHNGQKITEPQVKAKINGDEEYEASYKELQQAKYDLGVLKSIAKALEQRADMLVSLGSHLRHEANMTGMNIRDDVYSKAVDDAKQAIKSRK